jgi:enolase-phosphatase E1
MAIAQCSARCVLLDIEGTVSDIRFVYDVMFPYAKNELNRFLQRHWTDTQVQSAIHVVAEDAGIPNVDEWLGCNWKQHPEKASDIVNDHLQHLMSTDSKATGLKQLQGLVWRSGFERGIIRAELFPDVLPALSEWKRSGIDLRIFSSGSVLAQMLFFKHTVLGDLSYLFSAHYDTTLGSKKEKASYERIAAESKFEPHDIIFITDVYSEIVAAEKAGMQVIASIRPNNVALPTEFSGLAISDFFQLQISM